MIEQKFLPLHRLAKNETIKSCFVFIVFLPNIITRLFTKNKSLITY
jgi:hypothetical protein